MSPRPDESLPCYRCERRVERPQPGPLAQRFSVCEICRAKLNVEAAHVGVRVGSDGRRRQEAPSP